MNLTEGMVLDRGSGAGQGGENTDGGGLFGNCGPSDCTGVDGVAEMYGGGKKISSSSDPLGGLFLLAPSCSFLKPVVPNQTQGSTTVVV